MGDRYRLDTGGSQDPAPPLKASRRIVDRVCADIRMRSPLPAMKIWRKLFKLRNTCTLQPASRRSSMAGNFGDVFNLAPLRKSRNLILRYCVVNGAEIST